MAKEASIHNEENTVSSINGVGEIRQKCAKESKWSTLLHDTQK